MEETEVFKVWSDRSTNAPKAETAAENIKNSKIRIKRFNYKFPFSRVY